MAHFRTTVESAASPAEAFALVADFSNIAQWDPGVISSERLDSDSVGVGSRFRVISAFGPRRIPLDYHVLEWNPNHRAVLEARTRDFRSYDVISTAPTTLGSAVTYDALLELNGVRKILEPVLSATFQIVGRRAESGMRKALRTAAAR
ncbi:MAG: SRPBCC family protein [Candidatus Nanopelagicales bacterium]